MRIAVPVWMNRISPVFDEARELLLVDLEGCGHAEQTVHLGNASGGARRVETLAILGVDVLICCAVSQPLEQMLQSQGMHVIANVCGDVGTVIEAFVAHRLDTDASLHLLRDVGHEGGTAIALTPRCPAAPPGAL